MAHVCTRISQSVSWIFGWLAKFAVFFIVADVSLLKWPQLAYLQRMLCWISGKFRKCGQMFTYKTLAASFFYIHMLMLWKPSLTVKCLSATMQLHFVALLSSWGQKTLGCYNCVLATNSWLWSCLFIDAKPKIGSEYMKSIFIIWNLLKTK